MAERFSRFSFGTKVYAEWRIIVEKENIITIHALGDSLVTAYGDDESNFIGGWGDHLWSFFDHCIFNRNYLFFIFSLFHAITYDSMG